jgi:hypothetical protein
MLVECSRCGATVNADVEATYDSYDDELRVPERYTFAKCPKCAGPFLLLQNQWGDSWDEPGRLYPPRDDLLGWSIPKPISTAFSEAARCHAAKAYTACALMCRKTLEGVCDDHKVKGKTLQQRLAALRDDGAIEGRLYEWADELRLVGNEAAHDVHVQVGPEDARDTFEFTRALLEYAYTFRHRFAAFKKRRLKANSSKGQPPSPGNDNL